MTSVASSMLQRSLFSVMFSRDLSKRELAASSLVVDDAIVSVISFSPTLQTVHLPTQHFNLEVEGPGCESASR